MADKSAKPVPWDAEKVASGQPDASERRLTTALSQEWPEPQQISRARRTTCRVSGSGLEVPRP